MNETIDYFNENAQNFKNNKSFRDIENIADDFLTHVRAGGDILDLGCGCGWDAKLFVQKGYNVTLLDGAQNMCEIASTYVGSRAICKEFYEIDDEHIYDGIWANESLIHLPLEQQIPTWTKLYRALKPGGVIYASYYYGEGVRQKGKCFYFDINGDEISEIIKEAGTWDNIEVWMTKELHYGKHETFTNIFALKV